MDQTASIEGASSPCGADEATVTASPEIVAAETATVVDDDELVSAAPSGSKEHEMEAAAGELDYEQARTLSVSALCACDLHSVLTTWNSAAGPAWRRVGGLCPGRGSCR